MAAQINCGVAAFVKTPGLSPLKTRLAKSSSRQVADEFYDLSCVAVREVLQTTPGIHPYWAVAEEHGHDRWPSLPTLSQGEGGLGDRLAFVWQQLLDRHDYAMVIGTDCPQVTPATLEAALALLTAQDFVAGPARDGGFYLLASDRAVAAELWQQVPYSANNTWNELRQVLASLGSIVELPVLTDVDEVRDFAHLATELDSVAPLTPGQQTLQAWLKQQHS